LWDGASTSRRAEADQRQHRLQRLAKFLEAGGKQLHQNHPLDALFEKNERFWLIWWIHLPLKISQNGHFESSPSPHNGHFESKGRAEGRSRNFQILRSLGQDLDFRKCSGWSRPRQMAADHG